MFRMICGMGPEYILSAKKRSSMRRERILNGDMFTNERMLISGKPLTFVVDARHHREVVFMVGAMKLPYDFVKIIVSSVC